MKRLHNWKSSQNWLICLFGLKTDRSWGHLNNTRGVQDSIPRERERWKKETDFSNIKLNHKETKRSEIIEPTV